MLAWKPPSKIKILDWSCRYRYFAEGTSAIPGKYSAVYTPWVPYILEALEDKQVREIWILKSAGVSHTEGVLNNWIGWTIDQDPSGILGVFPKEEVAVKFIDEKFVPMVKATKRLHQKIDVFSQKKGNRTLYKKFDGGFLSLVTANVIANLQSTHLKKAFIEEPDRCTTNASGQGSPLSSIRDRLKTYHDSKLLAGGSPGIKGLSLTEAEYLAGDQRKFYVGCHDCKSSHVLTWDNIRWNDDTTQPPDEIYGHAKINTACYVCPHCGSIWSNTQKNINVRKNLTCEATTGFKGVASFYINSLYSCFPGDTLPKLVEKYLKAEKKRKEGDEAEMIVFVTTVLGQAYEFKGDTPQEDMLLDRVLKDLPPLTVPLGGLRVTAGIDIQSTGRIAIQIIAAGRGEEIWVCYFDELLGNVNDKNDPIWNALEAFMTTPLKHVNGKDMPISAISFDCSDGNTSDNVYDFIRRFKRKHPHIDIMAIKGSSVDYGSKEIFNKPKAIDTKGRNNTKSSRYGLHVFMVGTHRAKDLIYARLKLNGYGSGRFHFCQNLREDYFRQLLAEIKIPHKKRRGKEEYLKKSGVPNEALDTLVYALHALRSTRFHLLTEAQYQRMEQDLMQRSIFDLPENANKEVVLQHNGNPQIFETKRHNFLPDQGDWG